MLPHRGSPADQQFLAEVNAYIERYISKQVITLAMIADSLQMSHAAIRHKIRLLSGLSGSDYILKVRLQHSLHQMIHEHRNVSEAARESGFKDLSFFRNCFKDEYGMTPAEYRETLNPRYLRQAQQIGKFLMNHPRLPEDKVPYWDYDAPDIPNAKRDASAAAIMASALIQLSLERRGCGSRSRHQISKNPLTTILKMKQLLTTTLLLLLTLPMAAQKQEKQITVTENVAYRTDVGPSTVLDVAQPLFGPQTNRPAILIIHGGGWSAGSKNDMVYRTLMVDYAMKGYVVCNMNYRLVQEAPLPACIEDVQAAVRWMKSNAQKLGIDPQRIGTYGHSAGGHLSLMAGLTAGVACAAGGAPPTEIGRAGEWADHKEWWPIGYISKTATPFLVLQGGEDPVVRPNLTEDWVVKMQRTGTPVDYVKVHGNHGVAFDQQLEFTRPAMDAFYARHLKHDDPTVSFEQLKVPDYGGSGRHKAVAVREKSLPDFVVYRPMNIDAAMTVGRPGMFATGQPNKEKLPVLVFCNGGCMDTSIGYENMLTDIASHGYVVVAIGELQMMAQHEKDQHTPSSMVKRALEWICSPASPYYNYIDTEKIAAAGHSCGGAQVLANAADPRLKTYIILNAGMGKMTMADASAKSLKNLHGPILYLVGGTSDVAWQNAQQDYKAIKRVPVVLADNTQSGHGGTYEQPNGGANARMVRAWLDWQLKGNKENERLFIGGDLTGYDGFTIKHKNYK